MPLAVCCCRHPVAVSPVPSLLSPLIPTPLHSLPCPSILSHPLPHSQIPYPQSPHGSLNHCCPLPPLPPPRLFYHPFSRVPFTNSCTTPLLPSPCRGTAVNSFAQPKQRHTNVRTSCPSLGWVLVAIVSIGPTVCAMGGGAI